MLNSTFIVDDDFTLNVIEEPEEDCSPVKSGEYINVKEEVKLQAENDVTLNIIKDSNSKDSSNIDLSRKLEFSVVDEQEESDFAQNVKESVNTSISSSQKTSDENNVELKEDKALKPNTNLVIDLHKRSNFSCSRCGYRTDKYSTFLTHIDAHLENQRQYKCASCNFVTFIKGQLSLHKARCDYVHKLFCAQCSYVTTKPKLLRKHIDSKHLGKRAPIYKCHRCKFRSKNRDETIQHKNEFHPRPTYKCERCSFEATSKLALKQHEDVHGRKVTIRKRLHKCDLCSFENSNKKVIRRHMKIHHKVEKTTVNNGEGSVVGQVEVGCKT